MRALWTERPASFEGRFYQLEEAGYQPQPAPGRPPIVIGGAGERRTLRIAAEHADEWNCVTVTEPEGYAHKVEVLERHCEAVGRDPATIARSMMAFPIAAPNERALKGQTARTMAHFSLDPEASPRVLLGRMEGKGILSGTTDEVVDKLGKLAELGLRRWSCSTSTSTRTRRRSTSPPTSRRRWRTCSGYSGVYSTPILASSSTRTSSMMSPAPEARTMPSASIKNVVGMPSRR